ncbi:MAG: hypothetical protein HGB08_04510 [Candidatus Moranbacteria bacterium]|nr:hypothetical protein [Candidatus Moranbacteria bacterium]
MEIDYLIQQTATGETTAWLVETAIKLAEELREKDPGNSLLALIYFNDYASKKEFERRFPADGNSVESLRSHWKQYVEALRNALDDEQI